MPSSSRIAPGAPSGLRRRRARDRATAHRPAAVAAGRRARRRSPASAARRPTAGRRALPQIGEAGKELIDELSRRRCVPTALTRATRHRQIFGDRQVGKHLLALRHQRDAEPVIVVRRPFSMRSPLKVMVPSVIGVVECRGSRRWRAAWWFCRRRWCRGSPRSALRRRSARCPAPR